MVQHWLLKSEPDVFSIEDLRRVNRTWWEGVRNYQARNFMKNQMQVGDLALFYHSNCSPPGVAGWMKISQPAQVDHSAMDPHSKYFDPQAKAEAPRWYCVEVEFARAFARTVSLPELRGASALRGMMILRPGNRLSITPVTAAEFEWILKLSESAPGALTKAEPQARRKSNSTAIQARLPERS